MPDYDFRTLSPIDFEHLARDALNADLGLSLQSYAAGRDQGIDLRQVTADGMIIVGQCKHYLGSSWSTFMRAVRGEVSKAQGLNASRYLFVTSRDLSPRQHSEIVLALGPLGVLHDDVWGRGALNGALVRHPEVERRHLKLWLWSTAVLESVVNAGRWQRSSATLEDARDHGRLWVHSPVYDRVAEVLGREGVCVVYGPPGVGKTFLAEMTLLSAVTRDDWEAVHLSGDIEDGWSALRRDDSRQFFYFNDFLGETELSVASKNEPTNLERFIGYIRQRRQHKRFLMTTRSQILGDAVSSVYDPLRRVVADMDRIGVRLDGYSARARAEILFNHLYFSEVSLRERERLAVDNRIVSIVSHAGYNPRLVELAIGRSSGQSAEGVLETIRSYLDRPDEVWSTSFVALSATGQQVLLSLASLPSRPWPVDQVRLLVGSTGALDWSRTLRMLEPTWVRISDRHLALANPSCREYLLGVLDDPFVASEQVDRIRMLDQIVSLSRSAGLAADVPRSVERPGLAHALVNRRDSLAEKVRSYVNADLGGKDRLDRRSVRVLADAAALLGWLGAEGDWLVDVVEPVSGEIVADPAALFMLAARLAALTVGDCDRRAALGERLVLTGLSKSRTTHDLDAYEDLPETLRTAAAPEAVRGYARDIIAAGLDDIARTADEAEAVRAAAEDLERRASCYGIEIDIGPLLDIAHDLEAAEATRTPEDNEAAPETGEEVAGSISELFSHLPD